MMTLQESIGAKILFAFGGEGTACNTSDLELCKACPSPARVLIASPSYARRRRGHAQGLRRCDAVSPLREVREHRGGFARAPLHAGRGPSASPP